MFLLRKTEMIHRCFHFLIYPFLVLSLKLDAERILKTYETLSLSFHIELKHFVVCTMQETWI